MPLTEPSPRRLKPVRLTDVPLELRLSAAKRLVHYAHDGDEAQELLAAALSPSDTVFYVTEDALQKVAA